MLKLKVTINKYIQFINIHCTFLHVLILSFNAKGIERVIHTTHTRSGICLSVCAYTNFNQRLWKWKALLSRIHVCMNVYEYINICMYVQKTTIFTCMHVRICLTYIHIQKVYRRFSIYLWKGVIATRFNERGKTIKFI